MSRDPERLYRLLPAIHRIRDAEQGEPLRAFLAVIAEQVAALEENLDQLYDDQFVETCADWVVPYLGDLIGYRALHGVVPRVASPRAEVANTIRYRRRKGTAAMLEQLARDVTGWPARAVEFFQLLGWTQYMNHRRPEARYAPDLRRHARLRWLDTAFDSHAHTVDVRHIARGAGKHNIPNVGLFLWRLQAFPLSRSPAVPDLLADPGGRLFRFDPLGVDRPLFTLPRTEDEITHLAEPLDVPLAIPLRWMVGREADYYGPGLSLFLERAGANPGEAPTAIGLAEIRVCDLSDVAGGWAHVDQLTPNQVGIDPERGRIAFGTAPAGTVLASFHYGFARAMAGGEYERGLSAASEPVRSVGGGAALQAELDALSGGGTLVISDSGRYAETLSITVNDGASLNLRAADGARPLLISGGDLVLNLGEEATLVIDGLLISGGALVLRHCTLVPGLDLNLPPGPLLAPPSLVVDHPFAEVLIEDCILGPLHAVAGARVRLADSILDGTDPEAPVYHGLPGELEPGADLTAERCTLIGKVHAREFSLLSNCLLHARLAPGDTWAAPVLAQRRQLGCVRFSYVPPGALTPRRFQCQPEDGDTRLRPQFRSLRYGDAAYAQLSASTPAALRRGAEGESEMGVFFDLHQPQRETNLRVRLEEYLRFGLEAGLFYAS